MKIEKEQLRNENKAKRQEFLAECKAENEQTRKQLQQVAAQKEKRRVDRMEAHAKWVAENPGGAMAKVKEHQEATLRLAEEGRAQSRQIEEVLEQRNNYFLEMNTAQADAIKAAKASVCEAAKKAARDAKMDLANERKQMAKVGILHCARFGEL